MKQSVTMKNERGNEIWLLRLILIYLIPLFNQHLARTLYVLKHLAQHHGGDPEKNW